MKKPIPSAAGVLKAIRGAAMPTDAAIAATCEQCGLDRRLSECRQSLDVTERTYRCPSCSERLVMIRRPNEAGIPIVDSGYRLGDWVLANAVEIVFEGVTIPACTAATTLDIRLKQAGAVEDPVSDLTKGEG